MSIALTLALVLVLLPNAAASAAQGDDLAVRTRAASRAMSEGRFDDAAGVYRDLLKGRPDDPRLLMNLGMALAMAGRESEALPVLQRAIERDPSLVPAHLFLGSSYLALGEPQKAIAPLERALAAQPASIEHRRLVASAYVAVGRHADALAHLRRVTELAPSEPAAWYALGHAYNAVAQDAMATFEAPADAAWADLLVADALFADGRLTDAFATYRAVQERLPAMVSIHDAVARIYTSTGHPDWAAAEKARGVLTPAACRQRAPLCEFRAGRYRPALAAAMKQDDPESRYWRARAATELAKAAFSRLDKLPDSRERREVRAMKATAERRYADAIVELEAALKFEPGDPALLADLATAHYSARDYERAAAILARLVSAPAGGDPRLLTIYGDSLLQLQRTDEALPLLERAVKQVPDDPTPRLALARAYVQKGDFAAAIPHLEPQLAGDRDGSLHVQLARAYAGLGQREKADALLARSQELQRATQERDAAAGERKITGPPK